MPGGCYVCTRWFVLIDVGLTTLFVYAFYTLEKVKKNLTTHQNDVNSTSSLILNDLRANAKADDDLV